MAKKKVLHLITGLWVGGAEKMLLKTVPLLENRFDNRVCAIMGRGPIGKELEAKGIKVDYLELRSIIDVGIIWRFWRVVHEFCPDIMITYLIHADLFGRIWGKLFGIKKVICSQRGSLVNWEYLRAVDRVTSFLVDKYIVQTESAKKELMSKLNVSGAKFEVIPNGIDLNDFDFRIDRKQKESNLNIEQGRTNIVCVSNLRAGKGHRYLLEAFEILYSKIKNINLLIVGDGDQKEKMILQVNKYKSKKNICFLGHRRDVREILKISDIFVLATEGEGMSNAIMEAMACGVPIVTTDIAVNKELITKECGILVETNNSKALELALNELAVNTKLRKQLSLSGRKRIEVNYNLNKVVGDYERVLKEILI